MMTRLSEYLTLGRSSGGWGGGGGGGGWVGVGGLGRTRFETSSVKSQTQKLAFISVFTKFLIILFLVKTQLMTAKTATIVRDVKGLQQCHHRAKYTSFSCKDQRLSTEGKIVSKCCNISKTLGREGLHQLPQPPHCEGMHLRVRPRVKYH